MSLTLTERWMLVNQYRILEKLDPESANDHYTLAREALEQGFEAEYSQYARIDADVLTAEESRFVTDVLAMFASINIACRELPDKSGVDIASLRFDGFDGNNESKQLSYTSFLLRTHRWVEVIGTDAVNSHSRRLAMYERMVNAWQVSATPSKLIKEDLIRIREARSHPPDA